MNDIAALTNRFTEGGRRVFEHALRSAHEGGRNYVAAAHMVAALAAEENRLFAVLMHALRVDPNRAQQFIGKRLEDVPQHFGGGLRLAPETVGVLKAAARVRRNRGRDMIDSEDLLIALAEDEGGVFVEMVRSLGADVDAAGAEAQALYGCVLGLSRSLSRGER